MHSLASSSLEVLAHLLVMNVTVKYLRCWHRVARTAFTTVHISGPHLVQNNQRIRRSSWNILYPREEGREMARSGLGVRRLRQLGLLKELAWEATLLTMAVTSKNRYPRGRHLPKKKKKRRLGLRRGRFTNILVPKLFLPAWRRHTP